MPSSGWSGEIHQSAEFAAKIWAVGLSGGDALMGALTAKPPSGTGAINQGAVDVVPFAPLANTGSALALETWQRQSSAPSTLTRQRSPHANSSMGPARHTARKSRAHPFRPRARHHRPVSAELPSLAPGTTYHYRILATNAVDTSYGEDNTLTTTATAGKSPESTTPTTTTPTTSTTTTTTPTTTTAATPPTVGPTVVPNPPQSWPAPRPR